MGEPLLKNSEVPPEAEFEDAIGSEVTWQERDKPEELGEPAEAVESSPPSAGSPTEPEGARIERENPLKEAIQQASSIDELRQLLEHVPFITEGDSTVMGSDVAFSIKRANDELERSFDEVIIYTITNEENQGRRQFVEKFNQIIQGGDLGIQDKVRALMKEKMNERFEENKREFMVDSVASIRSFDTLYDVIRKFSVIDDSMIRWERSEKEGGVIGKKDHRDIRSTEELINWIKEAEEGIVKDLSEQKESIDQKNIDADEQVKQDWKQIGETLDRRWIPHDSGISRKVQQLIFEKVKDKYIDQARKEFQSSQSSEDSKSSEPSFIQRNFGGLKGKWQNWRSRRKKK